MSLHRDPARTLPAVLAAAAVTVAIWGQVLVGGSTFARGDYREETVPARMWAAERIAAGELPAWRDDVGLGVPHAANPRHAALYPPSWALAAAPRPWAVDVWMILHLVWLAAGIALLARRLGAEPIGAVIAGAAAAAGGAATSAMVTGGVAALAWTPWALVAADRLAGAGGLRSARAGGALALAAVPLAMQILAGGLWMAPATALLAHALLIPARREGEAAGRPATLLVAQLLAVVAAAAVVLPALALGAPGQPAAALPGVRAVELLWPGVSGDPAALAVPLGLRGPDPATAHLGLAPVLLALLALGEPRLRVLAAAAGALVAAAFLLSADSLGPASVVVTALIGPGLGRLMAARFDRRTALAAAASLVGFGAAVALVALQPSLLDGVLVGSDGAARRALIGGATGAGVLLLVAAVAVIIARSPRRHGWAVPLLGALLVGGAVAHAWQVMPRVSRSLVAGRPSMLAEIAVEPGPLPRVARPPLAGDRGPWEAAADRAERAHATAVGSPGGRLGALRGRDPAGPLVLDRAWAAAAAGGERLLDLWDVGHAVVPASVALPAGLPVVGQDLPSGSVVVHNQDRRPRAFVARRWSWQADAEAVIDALFAGGPRAEVALGTVQLIGDGPAPPELPGQTPPLPCELHQPRPERATLDCRSPDGGYAVLLEAVAPGWRARVDGEPADLVTADVLARAVRIDAGEHRIEMDYRVPGLRAGVLISLLGWLLIAAAAIISRLRRRPAAR